MGIECLMTKVTKNTNKLKEPSVLGLESQKLCGELKLYINLKKIKNFK